MLSLNPGLSYTEALAAQATKPMCRFPLTEGSLSDDILSEDQQPVMLHNMPLMRNYQKI